MTIFDFLKNSFERKISLFVFVENDQNDVLKKKRFDFFLIDVTIFLRDEKITTLFF